MQILYNIKTAHSGKISAFQKAKVIHITSLIITTVTFIAKMPDIVNYSPMEHYLPFNLWKHWVGSNTTIDYSVAAFPIISLWDLIKLCTCPSEHLSRADINLFYYSRCAIYRSVHFLKTNAHIYILYFHYKGKLLITMYICKEQN